MSELIQYPAEDVQPDENGKVPVFDRVIKALDPLVPLQEKAVCESSEDLLRSNGFKAVVRRFLRQSDGVEFEEEDFINRITNVLAGDVMESDDFHNALDALVVYWRNGKFRLQLTDTQGVGAIQSQEKFEVLLSSLVDKLRDHTPDNRLFEVRSMAAAVGTVIGEPERNQKNVFRVQEGGYAYPEGVDFETSCKRRSQGVQVPIQHGTPSRKDILGDVETQSWISCRVNLGGLPVEVCMNDHYADLLPGLKALMGGEAIEKIPTTVQPVMKLYFGVRDEVMKGDERRVFAHPEKRFLGMMVADIEGGVNPETGEDLKPGDLDYRKHHYFAYMKKSLLSMQNMWMLMLSASTQKQYYLDQIKKEDDPDERKRRTQQINDLKGGMPDELGSLHEKLSEMLIDPDPLMFVQRMPRVKIPEIDYDLEAGDFDPTRYAFLPVHGAFYTIEYENNKGEQRTKNIMFPGDSGVGKSEVMKALQSQGINVSNILADDMLYLIADRQTAQMYAVGDEGGAYTKTDGVTTESMQAMKDTPLVGYNAGEPSGNRRVVESGIATPLNAKKVEGIVELMNVEEIPDGEPRVQKVTLDETVENWVEGPYIPSSSIKGGGKKGGKSGKVRFWNEFGVPPLIRIQEYLVREILQREPDLAWANGDVDREAIVNRVNKERAKLFTAVAHTRGDDPEDLEATFQAVAKELADCLRAED